MLNYSNKSLCSKIVVYETVVTEHPQDLPDFFFFFPSLEVIHQALRHANKKSTAIEPSATTQSEQLKIKIILRLMTGTCNIAFPKKSSVLSNPISF